MDPMAKPFYLSKTFWFNVVGGTVELLQMLSASQLLPPGVVTMGLAVGNVILRGLTSQPMTFTGK